MNQDSKKYLRSELDLLKSELADDFDIEDFISDLENKEDNDE